MINLNVGTTTRHLSVLKSVFVQNGKYGDEIVFAWDVTGHPKISYISESYGIWSELYGEENFERMAKLVKLLTGEQIVKGGQLDESKLIGKKALLSFAEKNGNTYISSKREVKNEPVNQDSALNDAIGF